ncbi:hypothetical protein Trydic_g18917 [Trypoxylus dichotomus]
MQKLENVVACLLISEDGFENREKVEYDELETKNLEQLLGNPDEGEIILALGEVEKQNVNGYLQSADSINEREAGKI